VVQKAELRMMTYSDKILEALESTIKYLDGCISALKGGYENAFSDSVWHVAAQLEYALFMLSLNLGNGHTASSVKLNPEPKSLPIDQAMLKVKELVGAAQSFLKAGDLVNAYRNAYLASQYIFKVQESLAKKKHKAVKREK